MHFSIDRTVHTTAFDKPVVDHWLEWKIAQTAAGPTEKDRSDDKDISSATWDRSRETLIGAHISARWYLSSKINMTKWSLPDS